VLALADKPFISLSIGHLLFDLSVLFPSIFPPQIPMPMAEGWGGCFSQFYHASAKPKPFLLLKASNKFTALVNHHIYIDV